MDVTLSVTGMTCKGCESSVKRVLEAIPGVLSADVSLERKQALVRFDPSRTGVEAMKAAISEAGYEVP